MNLLSIVRAIWQLATYVFIGLPILIFLLPSAPWLVKNQIVHFIWLWFDRLVCTIVHFTWKRTISGWCGQNSSKKPHYKHQANVIDWLAELVGDKPLHCHRAHLWEQSKGFA